MNLLRYIIKCLLAMQLLQGVLLSAEIFNIDVKGVEVPVVFEQNKSLPIASIQLIFKVAGSVEDGDKSGLANFTARVLNDGNKALGSIGFAKELEQRAISLVTYAGVETLTFDLSSLKEQFPNGVKFLTSLIKEPNFTKESYDKNKILLLGRISQEENNFDTLASKELRKLIYTDKNFGASASLQSMEKITLEDIKKFYALHVDLSNLIVVAGGDLSKDDLIEFIKEIVNTLPVGSKRELKSYEIEKSSKTKEIIKPTQQAYIYFASPFYLNIDDKDAYKAKVASFILGEGGFGSRLMEEIRVKRGLVYSVHSRVALSKTSNRFSGLLQTKNETKDEAIKTVKEVIADFVKNGVTQEELEQAKKFLLGSEPLRVETLSQRLSRVFGEYYNGFEQGHSKKMLEKIEALDLEELNRFIKKHSEINLLSFAIVTNE